MKLLISTPCAGGMLYEGYVASLLESINRAKDDQIISDVQIHFQGKESLIHRGRDRAAKFFLEGDFDKLLTIDADISWTYEDFKRIVTSDKDLVGGIYPLKCFPIVANFNPLPDRGTELLKSERGIDLLALEEFARKYADPETGEAEVRHIATGFMCVTQEVFAKLSYSVEVYGSWDASSGQRKGFFHFYPSGVHDQILESEDWAFTRLAREAGFKAYLNTKVLLTHTGNHAFKLGQVYGTIDD